MRSNSTKRAKGERNTKRKRRDRKERKRGESKEGMEKTGGVEQKNTREKTKEKTWNENSKRKERKRIRKKEGERRKKRERDRNILTHLFLFCCLGNTCSLRRNDINNGKKKGWLRRRTQVRKYMQMS